METCLKRKDVQAPLECSYYEVLL